MVGVRDKEGDPKGCLRCYSPRWAAGGDIKKETWPRVIYGASHCAGQLGKTGPPRPCTLSREGDLV
jgi:hypothetical protein